MRNRIVHDYRGVDIDIVFSVIKDELPNLKQTLENIFFKLINEFEKKDIIEILNSKYYKNLSYLKNKII